MVKKVNNPKQIPTTLKAHPPSSPAPALPPAKAVSTTSPASVHLSDLDQLDSFPKNEPTASVNPSDVQAEAPLVKTLDLVNLSKEEAREDVEEAAHVEESDETEDIDEARGTSKRKNVSRPEGDQLQHSKETYPTMNMVLGRHVDLASIISSLEDSIDSISSRKRRKSNKEPIPAVSTACNLDSRRHLALRHFPNLDNLTKLERLSSKNPATAVFPNLKTLEIAPIVLHRLHPQTFPGQIKDTTARVKLLHHIGLLINPKEIILDLGIDKAEAGWERDYVGTGQYGCLCMDTLVKKLVGSIIDSKVDTVTIKIDLKALSTHYLTPHRTLCPTLRLIVTSSTHSHSEQARGCSIQDLKDAIGLYIGNRMKDLQNHSGGRTVFLIPGLDSHSVKAIVQEVKTFGGGERDGDGRKAGEGQKGRALLNSIDIIGDT